MIPSGDLNSLIQLRHLVSDAIDVSSSQFMANSKINKNRLTGQEKLLVWGSFWTTHDKYSSCFCQRLIKEVKGTPWDINESERLCFPKHFLLSQNKDLRTREIKTFIGGIAETRVSLADSLTVLNKAIAVAEDNQSSDSLPQSIWEPS